MLFGPSEQEVATTLNSLVTHMCIKGREINSTKIQGPSMLVHLLVQWYEAYRDIPSKVKGKLFHLAVRGSFYIPCIQMLISVPRNLAAVQTLELLI